MLTRWRTTRYLLAEPCQHDREDGAKSPECGLPVLAGPVEATALGNVLVQARAAGFVTGDLESLRALVAQSFTPVRYEPRLR